jgi:hypothetical protein
MQAPWVVSLLLAVPEWASPSVNTPNWGKAVKRESLGMESYGRGNVRDKPLGWRQIAKWAIPGSKAVTRKHDGKATEVKSGGRLGRSKFGHSTMSKSCGQHPEVQKV